jgi:acetyl-CoA acetyltransferase
VEDVHIIGVGMTKFAKHLDRGLKSLVREALSEALKDAGLSMESLEAAWFSNTTWGYFSGQHSIRGQVALRAAGLEYIPIHNVENACASASTALYGAFLAVKSGEYDCALAIGAEKMYHEDREKMFSSFNVAVDVEKTEEQFALFRALGEDLPLTDEQLALGGRAGEDKSVFMDFYAGLARFHEARYGTTQEQLAVIASKNHFHSSLNPLAQFQRDMSVEEILAARVVAWPLTVPMCAPIGDGAAAAIVCSDRFLRKLSGSRPVRIRAAVMGSGSNRSKEDDENDLAARVAIKAYERAGLGPEDIDVAEVHDATAFGELQAYEALGFCAQGDGGAWAESGASRLGGRLPVNPSGGLESRGHPIGASGLAMIYELVTQLRGEAGARQVQGARLALAENGGGIIGVEAAAMAVNILEGI